MRKFIHEDLQDIVAFYDEKLKKFGLTAAGVDWSSEAGQVLRFDQLCKIFPENEQGFSINDVGCGYGAFLEYLNYKNYKFQYAGYDLSEEMIKAAKAKFGNIDNANFLTKADSIATRDYSIASGIFNVRLDHSIEDWENYINHCLEELNRSSNKGFAFNCLTRYSDKDKMKSWLYYADPLALFDYCKNKYSRNVSILHDYGLYEFTILVRKT